MVHFKKTFLINADGTIKLNEEGFVKKDYSSLHEYLTEKNIGLQDGLGTQVANKTTHPITTQPRPSTPPPKTEELN